MNALVTIETLTPAVVFAPGGVEGIISKLEADVRAIDRDISTPDGREAVKSLAYKIARSKTALDDMGKELVAEIKKKSGAIDAERRLIRERMDALKDEVRGPLTEWEEAEANRIAGHESALVWLAESGRFATSPTSAMIRAQMVDIQLLSARDWQEFKERADAGVADATSKLEGMLATVEQAERDAAELAELRRIKAERDESDRIAAEAALQAERDRIANENRQRLEAEAAERATRDAAAAAEKARLAEIARAEQSKRDAEAAAAKAVEDERKRVAKAAADEKAAAEKREANKRHRAKIHSEIMNAFAGENMIAEFAEKVLEAIAAGRIPHVSITY